MSFNKISRRVFTRGDLEWFAEQSGDWNPIHVDPVAARRSLTGDVVVHGMLTLLWALECYCANSGKVPKKITVSFQRPISCGEAIDLFVEQISNTEDCLQIFNRKEVVTIIRTEGSCLMPNQGIPASEVLPRTEPSYLRFADIKDLSGVLELQAVSGHVKSQFPKLVEVIGLLPVAAIMASSRIVGMKCPGLLSLYSGAMFELVPDDESTGLNWKVVRHTLAQAPVRLSINGAGITGVLDAFVRPDPVLQPAISKIASQIEPGLCRGQVAWVIGGGRGLGEVVSKIVATGNGHVVLTYNQGEHDAVRVAEEITSWGGSCEIFHMDVHDNTTVMRMIQSVRAPTHLYFFASRKIVHSRNDFFDQALFGEFIETYVNSFARIIMAVSEITSYPLKIFYPSTVFIDELPKEFPEYVSAKSAGEVLCNYLSSQLTNFDIVVKRLPRLRTDQTNTLIRIPTSDPVEHLVPIVRQMSMTVNHGDL